MNRFVLGLALVLMPLPALADDIFCELPWFARNLIFDRAGYCFSSPLGRATFDNSDCTGTDVVLSDRDRAAVDHILELESYLHCAIDNSAPHLEHEARFAYLRAADVIPVPVEDESACIGYRGPVLMLHAAPDPAARVIGTLLPGDDVGFIFRSEGAWEYVLIEGKGSGDAPLRHGWAPVGLGHIACEMYAG